jgi:hypothetical protein
MAKKNDQKRGGKGGYVGDLLPQVIDKYRLRKKIELYRLFARWPEVVGPQLVKKCRPLFISRKKLHVKVVNHAWMHQLYFFQDRIIGRFNELAGGKIFITHLHFELGEIEVENHPKPDSPATTCSYRLISEWEKKKIKKEICRHVKDPELADILYQLRLKDRIQQLLN